MLYGICDLGYVEKDNALHLSQQLLQGGLEILQLRAKGHPPESLTDLAKDLKSLCEDYDADFIVNDHVDLAIESDAHGLHLGQDDGDLASAKEAFGDDRIYGRSTHSLAQAQAALAEGFDYIGFGPLYPTPTKKGRPAIGLDEVSEMMATVGHQIPAYCIGGIKPDNLDEVLASGAKNIVIVSHLLQSPNSTEETKTLLARLQPIA